MILYIWNNVFIYNKTYKWINIFIKIIVEKNYKKNKSQYNNNKKKY